MKLSYQVSLPYEDLFFRYRCKVKFFDAWVIPREFFELCLVLNNDRHPYAALQVLLPLLLILLISKVVVEVRLQLLHEFAFLDPFEVRRLLQLLNRAHQCIIDQRAEIAPRVALCVLSQVLEVRFLKGVMRPCVQLHDLLPCLLVGHWDQYLAFKPPQSSNIKLPRHVGRRKYRHPLGYVLDAVHLPEELSFDSPLRLALLARSLPP